MSGLHLFEVEHPNKDAEARYKSLVAIESQQEALLDELLLILDTKRADKWLKRHHAKGLPIAGRMLGGSPLVLLSGEVGCGKTELATTIGSPLARELDRMHGGGLYGECRSMGELTARHIFTMLDIDPNENDWDSPF